MADDIQADIFRGGEPPANEGEVRRLLMTRLGFLAGALRGLIADCSVGPADSQRYIGLAEDLRNDFAGWESFRTTEQRKISYKRELNRVRSLLKKPPGESWLEAAKMLDDLRDCLQLLWPPPAKPTPKPKRKYSDRKAFAGICEKCGSKMRIGSHRDRKRFAKCTNKQCAHKRIIVVTP